MSGASPLDSLIVNANLSDVELRAVARVTALLEAFWLAALCTTKEGGNSEYWHGNNPSENQLMEYTKDSRERAIKAFLTGGVI